MPQQAEAYLRSLQTSDRVRAVAWDAVYEPDARKAEELLRQLPLSDEAKATLWDMRAQPAQESTPLPAAATRGMMPQSTPETTSEIPYETPAERERRYTNEAMAYAPSAGGMIGGSMGGILGATLGGAAGKTVQQLSGGVPLDAQDIAIEGALQGGAQALGVGVGKAVSGGAKAVYRGYLKPSLSKQMAPRADEIVQTALDEALPMTRGGAEKGRRIITELKQEVDSILAQSQGRVDLKAVADRVRAFARRKYFKPGADVSDYKAALAVADRIDQHPSLGIPPGVKPSRIDVSLARANETKRALGESVGDTGFGVKTGAQRTTEKVAYGQTRRAVEQGQLAGEKSIGPLNAREHKLIDAARAIAHGAWREANRDQLIGVRSMAALAMGGGEYARSGDPAHAAAIALGARIGLQPSVVTRAAIAASKIANTMGVGAATAARLAVIAAQESPEQEE